MTTHKSYECSNCLHVEDIKTAHYDVIFDHCSVCSTDIHPYRPFNCIEPMKPFLAASNGKKVTIQ